MKTIDKKKLDELIRLTRKYEQTGDVDILPAITNAARDISTFTYGTDRKWTNFSDFIHSLVGVSGLVKTAPNRTVYAAFEAIGFEIKESPEEQPNG